MRPFQILRRRLNSGILWGIEEVIASKRVMQQSLFATQKDTPPKPDMQLIARAAAASQLWTLGLPAAALLVAVVALVIALLR